MPFQKGCIPWNKGKKSWVAGKKHPMWGKHPSEETKKKQSLAHKGKPNSGHFKKGATTWNKGKRMSEKSRKKMGRAQKELYEREPWRREIASKRMRGWQPTEEQRQKMRDAQKGRRHSEETKAKMRKSRARQVMKPITEETRERLSRVTKLENNPNWRGGKSFEPYTTEFNRELKEKIRKRDNYTCQECGKHQDNLERKLAIHHIDYDKKNNKETNLISLCMRCHLKTNFNRDDWIEYFKNKVK